MLRRTGGSAYALSIVAVLAGAASYGFLSTIIKLVYARGFAEADATVSQVVMGAVLMGVLYAVSPRAWGNPFRGPWIRLSLIGIFGMTLTTVLYNHALEELDASLAIVLLFQFTWITLVLEAVRSRAWPSAARVFSLVLILLGTGLSVELLHFDWSRVSLRGLSYGLGSALTYSYYIFSSGQVRCDWSPLLKSVVMLTAALPVLFLFYPLPSGVQPSVVSLVLWGGALGLIGQVLPNVLFMAGIPRLGGSLAAILGAMELPVGTISAFLLLGERVTGAQWCGVGLILVGVALSELPLGQLLGRWRIGRTER